jgi:hypothetical protein
MFDKCQELKNVDPAREFAAWTKTCCASQAHDGSLQLAEQSQIYILMILSATALNRGASVRRLIDGSLGND